MVTSSYALDSIRAAIERRYEILLRNLLTPDSDIQVAYVHTFLNPPDEVDFPETLAAARVKIRREGSRVPQGELSHFSPRMAEHLLFAQLEKMKTTTIANITKLIVENGAEYKRDSLQNPSRTVLQDELVKESTLGALNEKLLLTKQKANAEWRMVVLTQLGDMVGIASVDRIADDHLKATGDVDTNEVYVYRIPVNDSATCFSEEELILTADGTLKALKDLKVGDGVQTASRKLQKNSGLTRIESISTVQRELFEYAFEDGTTVRCTEEHPILVRSKHFLGFVPVDMLEKSIIPFKVAKYSELSTGDKCRLSNVGKWTEHLGYGKINDLLYFWTTKGRALIAGLNAATCREQFRSLLKDVKLNTQPKFSDLLKLSGFNPRRITTISNRGNYYNKRYHKLKPAKTTNYLNEHKSYFEKSLLEKGFRNTALDTGITHKTLVRWVKLEIGVATYREIVVAGRKRGGIARNLKINSVPGLREKLSRAARSRMLKKVGTASRPQPRVSPPAVSK